MHGFKWPINSTIASNIAEWWAAEFRQLLAGWLPHHSAATSGSNVTPGAAGSSSGSDEIGATGACGYNRPCAQQYVGKSQACMVISGRLIVHAPVAPIISSEPELEPAAPGVTLVAAE